MENLHNENQGPIVLPPHSNKMVWAILCTLFCCLLGGILAIVYSSQSNSAYNSSVYASDKEAQMRLFYESEKANKRANTWIIISVVWGIIVYICTGIGYLLG